MSDKFTSKIQIWSELRGFDYLAMSETLVLNTNEHNTLILDLHHFLNDWKKKFIKDGTL